jgi:hypothetical protein
VHSPLKPSLQSQADVVERLAESPTRFHVASECDRQLLASAAAKVVAQNQHEIGDFSGSLRRRRGPELTHCLSCGTTTL